MRNQPILMKHGDLVTKALFSECMFTSKFVILVLLKFVEIAFVKILRRHKKSPRMRVGLGPTLVMSRWWVNQCETF